MVSARKETVVTIVSSIFAVGCDDGPHSEDWALEATFYDCSICMEFGSGSETFSVAVRQAIYQRDLIEIYDELEFKEVRRYVSYKLAAGSI